ncbi:MAG: DNA polymerase IV [Planctomycetes bacterium]|nr:DNA polymerase IV [Planctomycetota bacterium]
MQPPRRNSTQSPAAPPAIFLVDIDAFFAQVEQILRPELAGRPVVVGGLVTDRSVVASASYEARARGVKTAMPIAQAHRICPDAAFLRGNFHAYARFSEAMMDLCRRYTPLVEAVSLDEAYLNVTGCRRLFQAQGVVSSAADPWPLEAAEHLKRTIRRELGLAVTIGVGTSRLVAKIACDYAKPSGIAWIHPGREERFLAPLPLAELPGIGPKTAERLARYNLRQIGDLARIPAALVAGHFGPAGEALAARARGCDPTPVDPDPGGPKSISRQATFQANLIDRGPMKAMLYYLLERACRQLRGAGLLARTVTVKVRYADFRTEARGRSLPTFSDHDDDFWPVASALFNKVHTRRVGVRLVGVALGHFAPAGRQLDLFGERRYERRSRLYRAIDGLRRRFGFSVLVTGRAIELLATHDRDEHGFRLRTACLSR